MRYFIIADEQGNPLYYDHPEGRMLSLILVNTHLLVLTNFGQRFKSMSCGNVKFVYTMYSKLSFIVVSDQGESEMYLRTQLQQIFDHLVMVFGKEAVMEGKYTFFSRHKKKIQYIIDTLCDLGDKHQSMLIRATERLEVDESTRDLCFKGLKKVVKNESLATHGMIFVGTKRLASYSKSGAGSDLDPTDVLLLINHFRATFHPYVREVHESEVPVADYTAHTSTPPISITESGNNNANLAPRGESDGFVSASEELEELEKEAELAAVSTKLLSPALATALFEKMKVVEEAENEGKSSDRELMFSCDESFKHKSLLLSLSSSNVFDSPLKGDEGEGAEAEAAAAAEKNEQEELNRIILEFLTGLDQDNFQVGSSGEHVLLLQEMLSVISYLPGELNGDYNENTALAVSAFQANSNIEKTGIPNFFTVKLLIEQVVKYYAKRRRLDMKRRRRARLREKKSGSKGSLPILEEEGEPIHNNNDNNNEPQGAQGGGGGGVEDKAGSDDEVDLDDDEEDGDEESSTTDDEVEDDVFLKSKGDGDAERQALGEGGEDGVQSSDSGTVIKRKKKGHHRRQTQALASRLNDSDHLNPVGAGTFKIPSSPQNDGAERRRLSARQSVGGEISADNLMNVTTDLQTFPLLDSSIASSSSDEEGEQEQEAKRRLRESQKEKIMQQIHKQPVATRSINGEELGAVPTDHAHGDLKAGDRPSKRTGNHHNKNEAGGARYSSGSSSLSSSPEIPNYMAAVLSSSSSSSPSPSSPRTPRIEISHDFHDSTFQRNTPYMQSPRQTFFHRRYESGGSGETNSLNISAENAELLASTPVHHSHHWQEYKPGKEKERPTVTESMEDKLSSTTTIHTRDGSGGITVSQQHKQPQQQQAVKTEEEEEEQEEVGTEDPKSATVIKRTVEAPATGGNTVGGAGEGGRKDTTTMTTSTESLVVDGEKEKEKGDSDNSSIHPAMHQSHEDDEDLEAFDKSNQDLMLPDIPFDPSFDPTNATAYQLLYLRLPKYTPRWVYFAELETSTTLVVVCSNHPSYGAKGDPSERSRLDTIRDKMRKLIKPYASYLLTKELTHLPILTFLHQFPGLVHFIFVDRTHNRVIAPTITSLHGIEYFAAITETIAKPTKTKEEKHMLLESLKLQQLLKDKIWDMCYQAQQKLSEGYFFMLMKSGAFQYSYRLWVEDTEHDEAAFTLENRITPMQTPQNFRFYKDLVKKSFPSRSGLRCYELYTLYLGVLSVKSVINHDKNLVNILKK